MFALASGLISYHAEDQQPTFMHCLGLCFVESTVRALVLLQCNVDVVLLSTLFQVSSNSVLEYYISSTVSVRGLL